MTDKRPVDHCVMAIVDQLDVDGALIYNKATGFGDPEEAAG
jgi:hypothetical protein